MSFVTMSTAAMIGTGAALGAGMGAAGGAISGGDIGEAALMGAATGALTAGVGSAVAAPAAAVGSSTLAPAASGIGGASATTIPSGVIAGSTGTVNAAVVPGVTTIAPAAVAPGAGITALPAYQQAGIAGGSRFGVGMASGEDVEQAGIAGLTAAGSTAVMSGLGDLATTPVDNLGTGDVGAGVDLAPEVVGVVPDAGADIYPDANFPSYKSAMGPKGHLVAEGYSADAPLNEVPSAYGARQVGPDLVSNLGALEPGVGKYSSDLVPADPKFDPAFAGRGKGFTHTEYAGVDPKGETPFSAMRPVTGEPRNMFTDGLPYEYSLDKTLTGAVDAADQFTDNFGSWDKATASIGQIAPEAAVTGAGMMLQGGYDDRMAADAKKAGYEADREAKRQEYWDTVNAINSSYGRLGRTPPTAPGQKPGTWALGPGYAHGGVAGRYIEGRGTGESDSIPAIVDDSEPARLSSGEFVVPARTVQAAGGPNSFASVLDRITRARGMKDRQRV